MKILVGIFLMLGLQACGQMPLVGHRQSEPPLPQLLLATQSQVQQGEVVPGSYIVAFKSSIQPQRLIRPSFFREYQDHYLEIASLDLFSKEVEDLRYLVGVDFAQTVAPSPESELSGLAPLRLFWQGEPAKSMPASVVKVDFEDEASARRLLQEWQEKDLFYFAEPNYDSRSTSERWNTYSEIYKDRSQSATWFEQIKLPEAMLELATTAPDGDVRPLVAVLDSGLDTLHPAFDQNIWQNTQPGVSGCADDFNGCNTTQAFKGSLGNGDITPVGAPGLGQTCLEGAAEKVCPHGTHVAGLIASDPQDQSFGGTCPVCIIMTVKIVGNPKLGGGKATSIADSSIIAGLNYVARFNPSGGTGTAVRLINASFGKFQRSRVIEHLIRVMRSKDGGGILVIGAAGNEDTQKRVYPAAFSDVIAVTNVKATPDSGNATKSVSSNYGLWTDIAAPGDDQTGEGLSGGLLSTVPGGGSERLRGTSMAAPVVTGIAALVLIADPNIGFDGLKSRILSTADPALYQNNLNSFYIPRIKGVPNKLPLLGVGVVNAENAIRDFSPAQLPRKLENRVTDGCGALGARNPLSKFSALLMLACPLFMIFGRRFF